MNSLPSLVMPIKESVAMRFKTIACNDQVPPLIAIHLIPARRNIHICATLHPVSVVTYTNFNAHVTQEITLMLRKH